MVQTVWKWVTSQVEMFADRKHHHVLTQICQARAELIGVRLHLLQLMSYSQLKTQLDKGKYTSQNSSWHLLLVRHHLEFA